MGNQVIYVKPHNLYSDKVVELHEFAGMLNLDRGYFMEGRSAYWIPDDITAIKAIELGAEYVDSGDNQCNSCGNKASMLYYRNGDRWITSDKSSRSVCYRCRIDKSIPSVAAQKDWSAKLITCPRCSKPRFKFPDGQKMCDSCFKNYNTPYRHGLTVGRAEDLSG